jgi:hypothetical protein
VTQGQGLITMPEASMNLLHDSRLRVTVAELAEIIRTDPINIANWIRRDIISRTPGRQPRSRLFSTEEVYKAALKHELMQLGIPPSLASEAVNTLWRQWAKKELPQGRSLYALISPIKEKWNVMLCSQRKNGGTLNEIGKSTGTMSSNEMALPKQAFAVIDISEVFERVTSRLSELIS